MVSYKRGGIILVALLIGIVTADASAAGLAYVGSILGWPLVAAAIVYRDVWLPKGDGTHQNPYAKDAPGYVGDEDGDG
jgi:hypothetical protein